MIAPAISVILCSHNPRPECISRAVKSLQLQTLPQQSWELLLIDNHSDVSLSGIVDLSWHARGRHLREERLGLTFARLCGIKNAFGQLLVFLDDDNVLEPDYLEEANRISARFGWLGAWGGQIVPEFEKSPPEWTRPYWCYLALRDVERDVWSNQLDFAHAPCGAGMCVRAEVARAYADQVANAPLRQMLGRNGNSLSAGEDSDLAFTACHLGLGIGLFRALKLTHLISAGRLEATYLQKLLRGISYSTEIVSFLHGKPRVHQQVSRARSLFDRYLHWRMHPSERALHQAWVDGRNAANRELAPLRQQSLS